MGQDPAALPRQAPVGAAAASLVYRAFQPGSTPPMPDAAQRAALAHRFPDALLFTYPRRGHALARDFKWLGSHRYGIVHLGGADRADLRARCESARFWANSAYSLMSDLRSRFHWAAKPRG